MNDECINKVKYIKQTYPDFFQVYGPSAIAIVQICFRAVSLGKIAEIAVTSGPYF